MKFVCKRVKSSDGLEIYADSNGNTSKTALVFIHGLRMTAGVFDILFANKEFAKKFHLVRYDLRGQGRSGAPKNAKGHESKLYAEDFAAVCDAFGVEKPYMVGWSYGCTVLADIAAHLPHDYLSGAVNLCGPPYLGPALERVVTPAAAHILPSLGSATVPAERYEEDVARLAILAFTDIDNVPTAIRWWWRGMMSAAPPSSYGFASHREQDWKPFKTLARKGFPLLVIAGTDDHVVVPAKLLDELSKYFVNMSTLVVDKGSHVVFFEQPQVVADSISSFIRNNQWRNETSSATL